MSMSKKSTTKTTSTTETTPMPKTTPAIAASPLPLAPAPAATPPAPPSPPPGDPNDALVALVTQAVSELDALEAQLGADPPISPADKQHSSRMRKGGANVLTMITALATQHGIESPAMQVAPIAEEAGRASALQPLSNRLAAFGKHVDDLIFQAQSAAWDGGLQFYAVLQRLARSDNDLAAALQPVTQFFAYRHKTPQPAGTPTKRQRKATTKAVGMLKKTAPQLLAAPAAPAAPTAPVAAVTTPTPKG